MLDSYSGSRAAGELALQATRRVRQVAAEVSLMDMQELSCMHSQQQAVFAEMRNGLHVQHRVKATAASQETKHPRQAATQSIALCLSAPHVA